MVDFLTFENIQDDVVRAVKDYNKTKLTLVKMHINMVYLNEIMVYDKLRPLHWMIDLDDSLQAQAPKNITGISKANPGVFTVDEDHFYNVGDIVTQHNIGGMTPLNDKAYQVATVPSSTTYSLGVNTSTYTTYTSGGTSHHRGVTLQTNKKPVQKVFQAGWHDEGKMTPILPKEIEENPNRYHWTDTIHRPERYMHGLTFNSLGGRVDQLIWHSGSDQQYTLRYWFEKRAPRLINDADVPLLPAQFHHTIIAGAIMRLSENNVQVENQVVWPGIYLEHLKSLALFNKEYWEDAEKALNPSPYLL